MKIAFSLKAIAISIFLFGMVAFNSPIQAQSKCSTQYSSCMKSVQAYVNSCVSQAEQQFNPESACAQYNGTEGYYMCVDSYQEVEQMVINDCQSMGQDGTDSCDIEYTQCLSTARLEKPLDWNSEKDLPASTQTLALLKSLSTNQKNL
jgi:hypothetical protein